MHAAIELKLAEDWGAVAVHCFYRGERDVGGRRKGYSQHVVWIGRDKASVGGVEKDVSHCGGAVCWQTARVVGEYVAAVGGVDGFGAVAGGGQILHGGRCSQASAVAGGPWCQWVGGVRCVGC